MPNDYPTVLYCDHAIDPTPRYHKWDITWSFMFVCSVINEHDFISDFIVVLNWFSIFEDIIFINLRLLSLTY